MVFFSYAFRAELKMAMLQVGDGVDGERKWLAKKSEVEKRTSF